MVDPLCPYFGTCGGCTSQHIAYEDQVLQKRKALESATGTQEVRVITGNPYHYRNRMDFVFHPRGLGLRRKGEWWSIVDIERCVISNANLNTLLAEVRSSFNEVEAFDVKKKRGLYRYAVIRTPQHDSSISFVLNEDASNKQEAIERIKTFAERSTAKNVLVTYVSCETDSSVSDENFVIKGDAFLTETILGKQFKYSIQGFFQNNSELLQEMHSYVQGLLKGYDTQHATLLDLYGGVGTFGILNASLFKKAVVVESVQSCIDACNENISLNSASNVTGICLDAMQLRKLELPSPLFVITDPPRSGMHPKTIQRLRELQPEVVIYISCNMEQLAKDLPKFPQYRVKSAALFDFFPQTPHSEAVVELVKKEEQVDNI